MNKRKPQPKMSDEILDGFRQIGSVLGTNAMLAVAIDARTSRKGGELAKALHALALDADPKAVKAMQEGFFWSIENALMKGMKDGPAKGDVFPPPYKAPDMPIGEPTRKRKTTAAK